MNPICLVVVKVEIEFNYSKDLSNLEHKQRHFVRVDCSPEFIKPKAIIPNKAERVRLAEKAGNIYVFHFHLQT